MELASPKPACRVFSELLLITSALHPPSLTAIHHSSRPHWVPVWHPTTFIFTGWTYRECLQHPCSQVIPATLDAWVLLLKQMSSLAAASLHLETVGRNRPESSHFNTILPFHNSFIFVCVEYVTYTENTDSRWRAVFFPVHSLLLSSIPSHFLAVSTAVKVELCTIAWGDSFHPWYKVLANSCATHSTFNWAMS